MISNIHARTGAIGRPDDDKQDNQSDYPVRNVEHRKNLREALGKRPTGDRVRDPNLVNVAPLQFGKEVVDLHGSGC